MGNFLHAMKESLLTIMPLSIQVPIMNERERDYTSAGGSRKGVEEVWELAMKSMINAELPTRHLFFPIIKNRISNIKASKKYNDADMQILLHQFPKWTEQRIFEIHDLFRIFEVDGDGLIEILELCAGLDMMGDSTSTQERLKIFTDADIDASGSIDFQEFLNIMYLVEFKLDKEHKLAKTIEAVDLNIKFIRDMSSVQQIQTGYL